MICVGIARGRHRHMIAEHKFLADNGIGLVELRLDFIQGKVQVKRLLLIKYRFKMQMDQFQLVHFLHQKKLSLKPDPRSIIQKPVFINGLLKI